MRQGYLQQWILKKIALSLQGLGLINKGNIPTELLLICSYFSVSESWLYLNARWFEFYSSLARLPDPKRAFVEARYEALQEWPSRAYEDNGKITSSIEKIRLGIILTSHGARINVQSKIIGRALIEKNGSVFQLFMEGQWKVNTKSAVQQPGPASTVCLLLHNSLDIDCDILSALVSFCDVFFLIMIFTHQSGWYGPNLLSISILSWCHKVLLHTKSGTFPLKFFIHL